MDCFLLAGFFLATLTQLFFWLFFFARLIRYRPPARKEGEEQPPVSVIICARNEAENLKRNLPLFLNQTYRSFEVIVVNDNSTDDTGRVLLEFQSKNTILRIVTLTRKTPPGKKAALSRGIDAARFDLVLLSDADCRPASEYWIRDMQAALENGKEIALGYSPYEKRKGLLNLFIRFEAFYTAIQYLSFAMAGLPYMGVGRNLIYRKSLYRRVGGFLRHAHMASGDDDLFVSEAASRTNTNVALRPTAWVYSRPKSSWKGYYSQKKRHLTTGIRYRPVHQMLLGALALSHAAHYALGAGLLVYPVWLPVIITLYLVRIGVVSTCCVLISAKWNDPALGKWAPLLDVIFVGYYFLLAPVLLIGKRNQWN